jgi:hypothetical protein
LRLLQYRSPSTSPYSFPEGFSAAGLCLQASADSMNAKASGPLRLRPQRNFQSPIRSLSQNALCFY